MCLLSAWWDTFWFHRSSHPKCSVSYLSLLFSLFHRSHTFSLLALFDCSLSSAFFFCVLLFGRSLPSFSLVLSPSFSRPPGDKGAKGNIQALFSKVQGGAGSKGGKDGPSGAGRKAMKAMQKGKKGKGN